MAKNFDAKLVISTAEMRKEFTDARGQVNSLTQSLTALNKVVKESQGDLKAIAASISGIVTSSRQAASASKEMAQAKIAESRAAATSQAATDRHAQSLANEALAYSRANKESAQAGVHMARQAEITNRASTAARNAAASQDALGNSLSNNRYLLYDVGATYRTMAIGLMALPAASLAVATAYEKDFAQVIRTTGETSAASEQLRADLKKMATEIPLSFGQLSEIASIGGQMGIASESLGTFTNTVAKFVATSEGVTIDSATQAFGRLANLFAQDLDAKGQEDFFRRIGSAIAYTADQSVTSEKAIIAMMTKMAAVGAQAGMSAEEVTALASALTSVGIQPELGSGFVTRFFGNMNKTVAAGGQGMKDYAAALGITAQEFSNLVQTDPNALLTNMLKTMQGMSSVEQSAFLSDLGIKATRDQRVIQALASQLHVLADAQADVDQAFAKGTYLDATSAAIFDTFAANLQKLANSFSNLGDTLGRVFLPMMSDVVGGLTGFIAGFDQLLTNVPQLRALIGTLLTVGGVVGVFLALKSAASFITAGLIGFQHAAQAGVAKSLSLKGQVQQLASTMLAAKGASAEMSASLLANTTSMQALAIATNTTRAQMTGLAAGTMPEVNSSFTGFGGTVKGAGSALMGFVGGPLGIAITALGLLGMGWLNASIEAKQASEQVVNAFRASNEAGREALAEGMNTTVGLTDNGSFATMGKTFGDLARSVGVDSGKIADALEGGSASVRKLRDEMEAMKSGNPFASLNPDDISYKIDALDSVLEGYQTELENTERESEELSAINGDLGVSSEEVTKQLQLQEQEASDLASALDAAVASAFGLVNAEAAVQASLQKLGEGVGKSRDFSTGSEEGRSNLASLQATLAAQATLLQQNLQAGEISAQQAADSYSQYVASLMTGLADIGVDTTQIQGFANDAAVAVGAAFAETAPAEIPVTVNTEQFAGEVSAVFANLHGWLQSNTLTANMDLAGADAATQEAHAAVSYISQVTGMPFEAVVTAFTDPASAEAQAVGQYMHQVMGMDYQAVVNADTTPAITNVQRFASWAQGVLSGITGMLYDAANSVQDMPVLGALANPMRGLGTAIGGAANWLGGIAAPAQVTVAAIGKIPPAFQKAAVAASSAGKDMGEAAKIPLPDLSSLNDGLNKAAESGKKAGSGGKKAGDGLGKAGKAAKEAAPAVKDVADKMQEAADAASDYASRLGKAFDDIYTKTHGVGEATDAYYSKLNAIKTRREEELKTVRSLRAEIKSLNNERRGELTEAGKLEEMAKVAGKHGNTGRAKDYLEEADALRDSADEKGKKVKANEAEADSIMKGRDKMTGYTDAAIRNREEVRALEKAALDIPEAYAAAGASTDTIKRKTEEWTGKLKAHIGELGKEQKEFIKVKDNAKAYKGAVDSIPKTVKTTVSIKDNTRGTVGNIKKGIGGIPKSRTVGINPKMGSTSGVQSKLNSLTAPKTKHITVRLHGGARVTNGKMKDGSPIWTSVNPDGSNGSVKFFNKGGQVGQPKGYASGGHIPGKAPSNPGLDNLMGLVDGVEPIRVRSNEFIQSEPAVKHYGLDFMEKLNKMQLPKFAGGGSPGRSTSSGGSSTGLIDLSAASVNDIANAVAGLQIALFADNEKLAEAVNRGNEVIAQKGGRRAN